MIVTCEKCFSADDVSWQPLPDRMVLYTCSAGHGGDGPHTFVRSRTSVAAQTDEGAGRRD